MFRIFKWIRNIWNLNQLSDYIEALIKLDSELYALKKRVKRLERELKETSLFGCTTFFTDKMAASMAEAELKAAVEEDDPTIEVKWEAVQDSPSLCESKVTKVDKYYDPQIGVEYTTIELNGDKASPEDDTVKE